MMLEAEITECDMTGSRFNPPVMGYHLFARGATGRVCCVMTASKNSVRGEPVSYEELKEWAESAPGGYLDY